MDAQAFHELYGRYLDVSAIAKKRLDIAYGSLSDRQKLDIYYPETSESAAGLLRPCIIFFHGGAFIKGDKRRYQLAPALTGIGNGYAVVSVGYRLYPEARWSDPVLDAASAVAYVVGHAADLGIDASRIALWGESAGAHLALQVGCTDLTRYGVDRDVACAIASSVRAVVDWYASVNFATEPGQGSEALGGFGDIHQMIFGLEGDELVRGYEEANILTHLRVETLPAVFVEHGLADDIVSPDQSRWLVEALEERGTVVESRFVAGAHHGVADFEDSENLRLVFDFLKKTCG